MEATRLFRRFFKTARSFGLFVLGAVVVIGAAVMPRVFGGVSNHSVSQDFANADAVSCDSCESCASCDSCGCGGDGGGDAGGGDGGGGGDSCCGGK